jgi:hypothetical protein
VLLALVVVAVEPVLLWALFFLTILYCVTEELKMDVGRIRWNYS